METESPIAGAESSAWKMFGHPAAMEALAVDAEGRVRDGTGTAPVALDGAEWQRLQRGSAATHAVYLHTATGAIWRVRRIRMPAAPPAEQAPERPGGADASVPAKRMRQPGEGGLPVFWLERLWGEDPALRHLLAGYGLTQRETDIALFTMRGLSNKQIARRLGGLSPTTVRDCLHRIFAKIGARSRTEMVARILRIECPERAWPPPPPPNQES